jgi:hypothetical protein
VAGCRAAVNRFGGGSRILALELYLRGDVILAALIVVTYTHPCRRKAGERQTLRQDGGVLLILAARSVGIRLLREASTTLTRISTQTEPSWRLG